MLADMVERNGERNALVDHNAATSPPVHLEKLCGSMPSMLIFACGSSPDVHDSTWQEKLLWMSMLPCPSGESEPFMNNSF